MGVHNRRDFKDLNFLEYQRVTVCWLYSSSEHFNEASSIILCVHYHCQLFWSSSVLPHSYLLSICGNNVLKHLPHSWLQEKFLVPYLHSTPVCRREKDQVGQVASLSELCVQHSRCRLFYSCCPTCMWVGSRQPTEARGGGAYSIRGR